MTQEEAELGARVVLSLHLPSGGTLGEPLPLDDYASEFVVPAVHLLEGASLDADKISFEAATPQGEAVWVSGSQRSEGLTQCISTAAFPMKATLADRGPLTFRVLLNGETVTSRWLGAPNAVATSISRPAPRAKSGPIDPLPKAAISPALTPRVKDSTAELLGRLLAALNEHQSKSDQLARVLSEKRASAGRTSATADAELIASTRQFFNAAISTRSDVFRRLADKMARISEAFDALTETVVKVQEVARQPRLSQLNRRIERISSEIGQGPVLAWLSNKAAVDKQCKLLRSKLSSPSFREK